MNINHLGQNVGLIQGFFMGYPGKEDSKEKNDELKSFLNKLKYKYLIGVTANYYQTGAGTVLKQEGFRPVVSFYSSHGAAKENNETLTLWTKTQEDFEDLSKQEILEDLGYNCSVSFEREYTKRINITVINKDETDADLKKSGYVRVKNTPVYFKLQEEKVEHPKVFI